MGTLSATEAHTHVYVNSVVARGSLRESEVTAGSDAVARPLTIGSPHHDLTASAARSGQIPSIVRLFIIIIHISTAPNEVSLLPAPPLRCYGRQL